MYSVILTGYTLLLVYISTQGEKNYQILLLIMINKRGSLELAPEDSLSRPSGSTVLILMNVIALQGEPS